MCHWSGGGTAQREAGLAPWWSMQAGPRCHARAFKMSRLSSLTLVFAALEGKSDQGGGGGLAGESLEGK